jgi:hypothetical protein
LHAQKTLMHTEPIAITKVDNVSMRRFKQRPCRSRLQGNFGGMPAIRVYFRDTFVAIYN